MPPTDPTATVPLRDCPVGAVVAHAAFAHYVIVTADTLRDMPPDTPVRLLAPSLAALVARAEAGARLADAVENSVAALPAWNSEIGYFYAHFGPEGEDEQIQPVDPSTALGAMVCELNDSVDAYRKATA